MTVAPDEMSTGQEDPRYREGLACLQAGKFQEAIRSFEALLRAYPDSAPVQQALAEARFKANIDAKTHVRARRWIVPWRAIIFRLLVIVLIVLVAVAGFRLVSRQFAPALAQAETLRQQRQLFADGAARLEAGDLDAAEASFTELLAQAPDYPEAPQKLAQIKSARELDALYKRAVALQGTGQFDLALALFTDLLVRSPSYQDVGLRITAIKKQQEVDQLLADAEADLQAGRVADAMSKYEQITALNASYRRELIAGRLYEIYMRQGQGLIEGENAASAEVTQAKEYFSKALALRPRDTQAALEQRLASQYLAAQADSAAGAWQRAVSEFEFVYTQRPGYLGGKVIAPLYDAYIRNGDAISAGGD